MRLIDADALMKDVCGTRCGCMPDECKYNFNGDKYCEPYQYIKYAQTVDAVPLKPLCKWLSIYAAPFIGEYNPGERKRAWETVLKEIDWGERTMDGVTILNTYKAWTTLDTVFLLIAGLAIIGITIVFICCTSAYKDPVFSIFLSTACVCAFMIILCFYPKTEYIQATVNQSVSWAELTERYDVIRVDGRIITMIEKNEE